MSNRKNLVISTSTSTSTSSSQQWDELLETGNDKDDIFAPPSSPPPPHLIYIPQNYRNNAGVNSWQQNINTPPYYHHNEQQQPEKRKKNIPSVRVLRRQLFIFAKKLIKILLQNNNLLLIANVVNKLWKARANFINPSMYIIRNSIFIIKHDGYINLLKYTIHFVRYHLMDIFSKQQENYQRVAATSNVVSKFNRSQSPLTTAILMLKTTSHLAILARKFISRWLSRTIRNMGGLDSVILAFSAIAFTKTIQKSDRIF